MTLTDEQLEAFARAHDAEDAAQKGEPSPWDIDPDADDFPAFRAERLAAVRAGFEAFHRLQSRGFRRREG